MQCLPTLILILLSSFVSNVTTESVETEGDEYFGVPLGALHISTDGTSAEIYAADEYTIVFNHFSHRPRREGCTAMMVGPPRDLDKDNVVEGQGVLISLAQPPIQARSRRRHRRQSGSPFGSLFDDWPVEMDRLVLSPEKEKAPPSAAVKSSSSSKGSFTGIRIRQYDASSKNSTKSGASSKTDKYGRKPPTTLATTSTTTASTTTPRPTTTTRATTTTRPTTTTSTTTTQKTTQPLILFGQEKKVPTTRSRNRSKALDAVPILLGQQEDSAPYTLPTAEVNSKPSYYDPVPKPVEEETLGLPPLNERFDLDYANYLRRIAALYAENPRRAPALPGLNDITGTFDENRNQWLRPFDSDKESSPEPVQTAEPQLPTTTPLFVVIEDPREPRRQRLLKLREQVSGPTTTTTLKPLPRFDSKFELPYIVDKMAAFTLTNGAKVTDYDWIGLYDQCLQRRIPLVSLASVDPPKEEKIMPISGWSHNITSYRVHILNCNTILVPGFVYDAKNSTAHTYFMVGVGQFPENIERQVKAIVVGVRPGEGLRSYRGEDVLLKLPRPYRTFDIDFISIYNTDEQKSYGHVIIPSLLVPPCPEE